MIESVDIPISAFEDKRGHKGPDRRCIATGRTLPKSDLIRFVRSPEGEAIPDIAEKLPGRGVWVSADRESIEKAIKMKAFTRGFKETTKVADNVADLIEQLLARRVLGLLAMALKSGALLIGFDQVKSAAQTEALAWRIEACDGSADGRGKIRVLTKAVSRELDLPLPGVIGRFTASELGKVLGRDSLVHAAIKQGKLGSSLSVAVHRLSGFRSLIPESWPDAMHEKAREPKKKSQHRRADKS